MICRYFFIGFIDFMLKSKSLLGYRNLFSPNEYKKNDKIESKQVNMYCNVCNEYRKSKKRNEISYILKRKH